MEKWKKLHCCPESSIFRFSWQQHMCKRVCVVHTLIETISIWKIIFLLSCRAFFVCCRSISLLFHQTCWWVNESFPMFTPSLPPLRATLEGWSGAKVSSLLHFNLTYRKLSRLRKSKTTFFPVSSKWAFDTIARTWRIDRSWLTRLPTRKCSIFECRRNEKREN